MLERNSTAHNPCLPSTIFPESAHIKQLRQGKKCDVALYYSEGEKTEVNQSMTTKNLKNVSFYDNLQAFRKFLWQIFFIFYLFSLYVYVIK